MNYKLASLREIMRRERLGAFIFPSTDPHNGEYIPEHWEGRKWISGFNGSAGTAVVTMNAAALWTDSRYFIAAEEQLRDTEFTLMKLKMPGTPSISEWIGRQLADGDSTEVGVDGMVYSESEVSQLKAELRHAGGITVRTNLDPLAQIWTDRPAIPTSPVVIHPLEYCGRSCHEKLADIRRALYVKHASGMLVTALDDIAWTLNLRGTDVHCNPVFVSYLLISSDKATLYINPAKLSAEVTDYLRCEGVTVDRYENIRKGLADYLEYSILMDPDATCHTLYHAVKCKEIISEPSPIPALKAIKTEAEIAGFRKAMLNDGVALVKFHRWLDEQMALMAEGKEHERVTEMSIDRKLYELRSKQEGFRDLSFDTIAGYGPHGAIVHYEATEDTDVELKPEGFVLIDSGAQYSFGTTDITRTVALGRLTDEERLVYTLVLKGHIQLEMLKFPDGASGTQLDAMARASLWKHGYNFLHGTGHGVGSYLNVHEGPHQIRMEYRPAPMHAGMTVTDEPGIYVEGRFGVRIENTLIVEPYMTTDLGTFLQFDSLTLCPIDTRPIITDMMTPEELQWLNNYHKTVREALLPYLEPEDAHWLTTATAPLKNSYAFRLLDS